MPEYLPPLDDALGEAVDRAIAETGRTTLCVVDEAEMRAVGFKPPGRPAGVVEYPHAMAAMDDPVIVAAGERLVARGLATSTPTSRSVVTAAGPLLIWLSATIRGGFRDIVNMDLRDEPHSGPLARILLIDRSVSERTKVAYVQYLDAPADAGDEPLPVRIDIVRFDVLAQEVVADMFDGPPVGKRTLRILGWRDGKRAHPEPETLEIDGPHVLLAWYSRGLLGTSLKARRTDRDDFHLFLLRLLANSK